MSGNFDWRTEDDDARAQTGWDEPADQKPPDLHRRPPWRLIGVIAVLTIMVGVLVWWRVDKRIDETMQAFRTDVVASHNLVQQAVLDGDEEVFRSFLSGRDPAWTEGVLETFQSRLIIDRSPMGLVPVEGSLPAILPVSNEETAADERAADIQFSPDLNEAIVTIDQPYTFQLRQDTIILKQTIVYRRGDNRWLLAPPLDGFWGDWVTTEGEYLNIIYPSRDETVVERLATDLDEAIGRMCATLEDLDCSADLHLTARLDTDPDTLASLSRLLGPLRRSREREDILELPAPTLIGLPIEGDGNRQEVGYQALRDGYARYLLSAVIAQVTGWRCCDEEVLFDILLEYQLGELGLTPWPIGEADHQRVLDSRLRLSELNFLLRETDPSDLSEEQLWRARAAVDFLVKGLPGVSAADMQRTLGQSRSSDQFLDRTRAAVEPTGDGWPPANLDLAWWLYALGGAPPPTAPSDPFDDEELYLACQAEDGNQTSDLSRLLHYFPDDSQWAEVYSQQGFIWMSALSDPGMLLMQQFSLSSESWETNIWRSDGLSPAYTSADNNYSISLGQTDPVGRQLITYAVENDPGLTNILKVDLMNCGVEGCGASSLPGTPVWSPDGNLAIYAGDDGSIESFDSVLPLSNQRYIMLDSSSGHTELPLAIGPGEATLGSADLRPLGNGRSPFWVDNQTFGYIHRLEASGQGNQIVDDVIVLGTLEDTTPRQLISSVDLAQFLPTENRIRNLRLGYVATNPNLPQTLFIILLDELEYRAYVFSYDLAERAPQLVMDLYYHLGHSLGFSPDGRYLVLTGVDRETTAPAGDDSAILLLHNLVENRTIPFITRLPFFLPSVGYDWSDDGRWLALVLDDNLIGLVEPQEGYARLLPHGFGACTSIAWLRP